MLRAEVFMPIRARSLHFQILSGAVLGSLALVAALSGYAIYSMRRTAEEDLVRFRGETESLLKRGLRQPVDVALGFARGQDELVRRGVLPRDSAIARTVRIVASMRFDHGRGYVWINDTGTPIPRMVVHPILPALDGKILDQTKFECALGKKQNLFQAMVELTGKDTAGEAFVDYVWPDPKNPTQSLPKISYVKRFPAWGMVFGSGVYVDEIDTLVAHKRLEVEARIDVLKRRTLVGGAVLLAVVVLFGSLLAGSIRRRVDVVTDRVRELAEGHGDLTRRLGGHGEDELGLQARWIDRFLDSLAGLFGGVRDQAQAMTARIDGLSQGSRAMGESAERVRATAGTVLESSEGASRLLESVSQEAGTLSAGAQQVTGAIGEIELQARRVLEGCERESRLAVEAASSAREAQETIRRLETATEEISRILAVIREVSDRTRLLALNATIEAARAGEAGKGFAVVAGEVKDLARQTTESTQEIEARIGAVVEATRQSVSGMSQVAGEVDDLARIAEEVLEAVRAQTVQTAHVVAGSQETSAASQRIAQAVGGSSRELESIARSMRTLSELAETSAGCSRELESSSSSLATEAQRLRESMERFKI